MSERGEDKGVEYNAHMAKYWQTKFLRQLRKAIPKDEKPTAAPAETKTEGVAHVA